MPNVDWRSILTGGAYVVAGGLFIEAALQLTPPGPLSVAVLYGGLAIIIAMLTARFLSSGPQVGPASMAPVLAAWGAAGGAFLYGLAQVTPAGPARQFVGFAGAGLIIALIAWRFLTVRTFSAGTGSGEDETPQLKNTKRTRDMMLWFCYVGAGSLLFYSIRSVVPSGPVENLFRVFGAGMLIACSSLLCGALIGFLFGIPRAQPGGADRTTPSTASGETASNSNAVFQVNTNLEQISDWLTKIIVGLGLINLKKVPAYVQDLGAYFGASFGTAGVEANSVAITLIALFSVCGFLLGYLLTRLFLTQAFTEAESAAQRVKRIVRAAGDLQPGAPDAQRGPDRAQVVAAQRVNEAASDVDPEQLQRQVLALANEYQVTRKSMPFSAERTRLLDSIVARMRVLHGPNHGMLPRLTGSKLPGERLAAIAFLQMAPDPAYLDWLADRFNTEQPFLMYHAATALQKAADTLGPTHWTEIRQAIAKALSTLPAKETDTRNILTQADATLKDPEE